LQKKKGGDMNLYDRQKTLDLNIPNSACIIGLGGIGSWVALSLALLGVERLFLVDYDVLEIHNLNRTPFKLSDVGTTKAVALTNLILERRSDCYVFPIVEHIEDVDLSMIDTDLFIDCRDKFQPLDVGPNAKYVKLGYDGSSITFHFNPTPSVWGEETHTYTVTPSWLVPPMLVANLIVATISLNKWPEKEKVLTYNIEEILDMLKISK
jgi:hypothetical protein